MALQVLMNGLAGGLVLAILGMALQVVYLPTGILFFAVAGLFSFAPYVFTNALALGLPIPAAVVVTVALVSAASVLMELLSHGRLSRRGASAGVQLVTSLGYYILVVQLVSLVWGSQPRILGASSGHDSWVFLGMRLSPPPLTMLVGGTVVLLVVMSVLRFTGVGLRLRALADNPHQFQVLGYNVARYRLAIFGLSGALAATASLMLAYDLGFDPSAGLSPVLYAFVGLIVGGRRALYGAVVGGLLVGVVRAEVAWLLSARWQDAAVFALMAFFLLFAPAGLVGRRARLEAE